MTYTPSLTLVFIAALMAARTPDARKTPPPPTIKEQGSFFIGGHDVRSEALLDNGAPVAGTITVDQVYVRYQIPVGARRYPITLIHGCCLTGKTWETTPDGRMGWDDYFVRRGFSTYVIDQAGRGRAAGDETAIETVKLGKAPLDRLPTVRQAGREQAWVIFRFGPDYPNIFPGMQFPLESQAEFWKQMVHDWNMALPVPSPTVAALSDLAQRLRGTILISHSQSGIFPFQTAAFSTKGIAGIVAIEPGACPTGSGELTPYMGIPILVLWGDYTDQSPRWAPRVKACREFAEAVKKAGVKAEVVALPEVGIKGNSHMLMQDKNSLEVGDWLLNWIGKIK